MAIDLNQRVYSKNISQYPGYYEVKVLELFSFVGKSVDLTPFLIELNVYEDLTAPTLTGSITIFDSQNLIKNLPIIGEEILEIRISDQYAEMNRKFRVYKIANREQPNFGVLTYTLHFCSPEMYLNAFTRVSKGYSQTRYEDAVGDVLKNYLKSDRELRAGETKIPQSFILPNWQPFFALNWMASRSQDTNYIGGNFLFFEDLDRFNFVAVENLLDSSKNKPYAEVSLDPGRPTEDQRISFDGRQDKDVMRFESMKVVKSLDVLENMTFGMYKNMVRVIDIGVRGTETKTYDYLEEFDKSVHLSPLGDGVPNPLASSDNLAAVYDIPMENNVFVKSKGLFSDEPDGGFQVEDWFSPRLSQMYQMNNFVINGVLPGQMELRVGMIVRFKMPNPEHMDIQRPVVEPDQAYSGNYLITSIRRMFQKDKFWLSITMIKDSMSLDIDQKGREATAGP